MKPLMVEKVSKNFGGLQALDGISFEMEPGERRVLIGPNGAGKTTLFNIISGLLAPSNGRVFIFGKDVTRMPPHKRVVLGLGRTFQITDLFLNLTVEENLLLSLKSVDTTKHMFLKPLTSYRHLFLEAENLLRQFKLWEKRTAIVKDLSYGNRRQVEILMVLAQKLKLILLDEFTSGLSAEEIITMTSMLKSLPQDITLLLIEHNIDVAFELGEWIMVLHQGKLLAEGSQDKVKKNAQVQEIYLGSPKP